jgi:hypothetical protein
MGKRQAGGALTAATVPSRPAAPDEGRRAVVTVALRVAGPGGDFAAETVDVSRTGALVWIKDETFAPAPVTGNMVFYQQRVTEEFSAGMHLKFAGDVERSAEVVRVARKGTEDGDPILVACRFSKELSDDDYRAVGVEPGPAPEPESPEPEPKRRAKRARNVVERRTGPRADRIVGVELEGDYGGYKAHILSLSASGALVTVADAVLAIPQGPERPALLTKRMGFQFGNGVRIRFLGRDVTVPADVVRVGEQTAGREAAVVMGCRFRRHLTPDECRRLGLAPLGSSDPAHPTRSRRRDLVPAAETSSIRSLMRQAVECGATDLHVKVGGPPRLRVAGSLLNVGADEVDQDEAQAMALDLMTPEQAERFAAEGDVELAVTIGGVGRFRVNVLRQRGHTGLVVRCIPSAIPSFETLGLLPQARLLAEKPRGLVLVTGPTGAGKTTTLAAMVHHINCTRACHIVTMEDPIEYVHQDIEAHITQREIGADTTSFSAALKRALRQDPDVLLVGDLPAGPADADPPPAGGDAAGDHRADARAADRRGRGARAGDPDRERRRARPDPREQDPADPEPPADGQQGRHADARELAERSRAARCHHLRGRGLEGELPEADPAEMSRGEGGTMADTRDDGIRAAVEGALEEAGPDASTQQVEELLREYFSGKRDAVRTYKFLDVRVKGKRGAFRGMAVDISATGMLLRIIDKDFAAESETDRLMPYTARVWFHFESGLDVEFDEGKVSTSADVVRVTGYCGRGRGLILIGCRFREQLKAEQCRALGIDVGPDTPTRKVERSSSEESA